MKGKIIMTNRIHRYEKIERALKAILNFDQNTKSPYKWRNFGIFRRTLARAIDDCPGFIDMDILDCVDEILNEDPKKSMSKIKDLAESALDEISWEKRSGNDLYPCIEID